MKDQLNLPNEHFCVLPWVSLELGPTGSYKVCCLTNDVLTNEKKEPLTVRNATLSEISNCHSIIQLRKSFLKGEKHPTCKKCWSEEDAGRTSKRINTLDKMKHMGIANQTWTEKAKPLMFIDFKLGNICNLKCRICGSHSSSTYATEELQQIPKENRKHSFHHNVMVNGQWPRQLPNFWKEIEEISQEITYCEFTGGEPFMIQEHFNFLQTLIDRDLAKNIEIHYNTNGTQYPDHGPAIWKHFKNVEIAFSIDAVGPRFEYQRKNAEWVAVNENIEKFKQLKQTLGNITLQVCSTISVLNVIYLEELAAWIDEQKFDNVYWNVLHTAYYWSVASLPLSIKEIIITKLQASKVSDYHKGEFKNIVKFIKQGNSIEITDLHRAIIKMDIIRGEKLSDNHFELAEILGLQ